MPRSMTFFALLLLPLGAVAQETYTLKKKPLAAGDKLMVDMKVRSKFEAEKWSPSGRLLVNSGSEGDDRLSFTLFPLKTDKAGKLTDYYRHFTKAVRIQGEQTFPLTMDGEKFLYQLRDGKLEILSEKAEKLPPTMALEVEGQSIPLDPAKVNWEELLPKKQVKVGESWWIEPRRWVEDYEVDKEKIKAYANLKKVTNKEGMLVGSIDYVVDLPLTGTRYQGNKLPIKEGSYLRYVAAVDMCIDGKSNYYVSSGTLHIVGKARGPDSKGLDTRLDMTLHVEINERVGGSKK
ncbi:MAG: hypothetical protein U0793_04655 [Gemmataceae bacterium]